MPLESGRTNDSSHSACINSNNSSQLSCSQSNANPRRFHNRFEPTRAPAMTDANDIDELFRKCADLSARDPGFILKLSMGRLSLDDTKAVVTRMGKTVINIGDGLTLLHLAAQFGRSDLIDYLAGEKHHPLEVKTVHGETPLDQAAWRGHIDAAVTLLRYGADVDCATHLKYTPLHRCAFYNHHRLASLFCLAGANQRAIDSDGRTPYEVAVNRGNAKIAQLLKPIIVDGVNLTGVMYATNNPTHPRFRPEAREAFFRLYDAEAGYDDEEEEEEEEEEGADVAGVGAASEPAPESAPAAPPAEPAAVDHAPATSAPAAATEVLPTLPPPAVECGVSEVVVAPAAPAADDAASDIAI